MLAYQYNEFQIKKRFGTDTFYVIYKDGLPFSSIACTTSTVAKRVIDTAYPNKINSDLIPILQESERIEENLILGICECGCGETFLKGRFTAKKRFVFGHNVYKHRIKAKNIWNIKK